MSHCKENLTVVCGFLFFALTYPNSTKTCVALVEVYDLFISIGKSNTVGTVSLCAISLLEKTIIPFTLKHKYSMDQRHTVRLA